MIYEEQTYRQTEIPCFIQRDGFCPQLTDPKSETHTHTHTQVTSSKERWSKQVGSKGESIQSVVQTPF